MNGLTIKIKEQEYPLKTTLRVAYQAQAEFGHKPYMEIFQGVQKLKLEEQVKLLYISFNLANPDVYKYPDFLSTVLDEFSLVAVTETIAKLVEAITFNGMSPEEVERRKNAVEQGTAPTMLPTM